MKQSIANRRTKLHSILLGSAPIIERNENKWEKANELRAWRRDECNVNSPSLQTNHGETIILNSFYISYARTLVDDTEQFMLSFGLIFTCFPRFLTCFTFYAVIVVAVYTVFSNYAKFTGLLFIFSFRTETAR